MLLKSTLVDTLGTTTVVLVCPPRSVNMTSSDAPGAAPPNHLVESDQLPAPSTAALVLPFQIKPTCRMNNRLLVTGTLLVSRPVPFRLQVYEPCAMFVVLRVMFIGVLFVGAGFTSIAAPA